jgi:phosphonatase-like hydrolase
MSTSLVVFDIAGTTVKDKGNVAASFISAFVKQGFEIPAAEVNKVMGYRKKEAIRMLLDRFYPDIQNKDGLIEPIHESFEEIMLGFYMADKDLEPLPHAEEVFRWLHSKDIRVALNTGFTKVITEGILYRLDWKDNAMIDGVICSDEVPEGRPAPYMIQELMHRFNVADAADVVKVGDTEVDILEGRNALCGQVISVTTGAYSREQLLSYQPDTVIDDLADLMRLI